MLIHFDMEQCALKDLTLTLFERCCEAIDFPPAWPCKPTCAAAMDDAERIIDWARRTGRQVTVRLIKGAYWDYEVDQRRADGLADPRLDRKTRRPTPASSGWPSCSSTPFRASRARAASSWPPARTMSARSPTAGAVGETRPAESACETQKLSGMGDQLRARPEPARHADPRVCARWAR